MLDYPARRALMSADEVAEVDVDRHEVAAAIASFTANGARLLPPT